MAELAEELEIKPSVGSKDLKKSWKSPDHTQTCGCVCVCGCVYVWLYIYIYIYMTAFPETRVQISLNFQGKI